jgi:hypothetical protein
MPASIESFNDDAICLSGYGVMVSTARVQRPEGEGAGGGLPERRGEGELDLAHTVLAVDLVHQRPHLGILRASARDAGSARGNLVRDERSNCGTAKGGIHVMRQLQRERWSSNMCDHAFLCCGLGLCSS